MATITGVKITDGPQDWQILQRDREGFAAITLAGTWEAANSQLVVARNAALQSITPADASVRIAVLRFDNTGSLLRSPYRLGKFY